MDIRRGQVWWWDCPEHDRNHLEQGMRPVVVVSNDTCNTYSQVISVVPFTTSVKKPYPQQVPVIFNKSVSIAIADQITSIPAGELISFVCTLADFQMEQIDKAIAVQLGLVDLPKRAEGEL